MFSKSSKVGLIVAGTCILYLFSGCAKAPDTELAAAQAAVKAASDAEADKYMVKNYQNIKKALESSEAEIAKQKSAFFLTRKYTRVTKTLENITKVATEIAIDAPKAKENKIAQVKENLSLAKGILKETASDIKKTSRKKDKNLIAGLKADLSAAESTAVIADKSFETGDILKASDELVTFQELIKKITDQLNVKPEDM